MSKIDYPSWSGSDRKNRLPHNWSTLRNQVLHRDNHQCQAILNDGTQCVAQGTDVDHIEPGDNHDLTNLQLLCRWHHNKKSSAEGNRNRPRYREQRPSEKHPGVVD